MSKANDIVKRLVERLRTIRQDAGFATNAGLSVTRGQPAASGSSPVALFVFELEDQVEAQHGDGSGDTHGEKVSANVLLPIEIEGVADCDADDAADVAHALVADIKRAVFGGDMTWGGLATHTKYIGRTIDPRASGTNAATVRVQIRIGCSEDLANP